MTSSHLEPDAVRCTIAECTRVAAGTVLDLDDVRALPVCASHFVEQSAPLAS